VTFVGEEPSLDELLVDAIATVDDLRVALGMVRAKPEAGRTPGVRTQVEEARRALAIAGRHLERAHRKVRYGPE